jgi:hypothetical protein
MLVNLPNGKTVDMSFDEYLRISIDDYQYLMSQNFGMEMEDPFFSSILRSKRQTEDEEEEEEENEKDLPLEDGFLFESEE